MALGRGLSSLLSESKKANELKQHRLELKDKNALSVQKQSENIVVDLDISLLKASVYQPRQEFVDLAINELADSIREHGILDPLIVKKSLDEEGKYDIICGERRYRACKIAGLIKIPCFIKNVAHTEAYALALVENLQRQDLNPLEQAEALEQMQSECGINQDELAKTLGKSRSTVSNILRLNKLENGVKELLRKGSIDLGHAKVLLALNGDVQQKAAEVIVKKNLNVRQTENFIKAVKERGDDCLDSKKNKGKLKTDFLTNLEQDLNEKLNGIKFHVGGNQDHGKITLSYSSSRELDKIKVLLGLTS